MNAITVFVAGLAWATLGAADAPPELPVMPVAPVSIPVEMPYQGTIAVSVSDADGKTMLRRVVAEQRSEAGTTKVGWDLLDDQGAMLPAGTYRWTAITVPDITLTYEGTVNNGGNPPWPAPVRGGGQWLADHSPPSAACAVGDIMFLGAYCAESGHSAIAVDKDGTKLWGLGVVGGPWGGANRITTDGRYAYLANHYAVIRVDPENGFAQHEVVRFGYSAQLPAPVGGFGPADNDVVIDGERMMVAIDTPSIWLRGATDAGTLDLKACQPPPSIRDGEVDRHPSTAQRWQSALGLVNAQHNSNVSSLGPLLTDGAFVGTSTAVFTEPVPVASLLLSDDTAGVWVLRPEIDPAAAGLGAAVAPTSAAEESVEEIEPFDEALWQPLHVAKRGAAASGAALATADEPVWTRAVRFKATKPLAFAVPLDRRYTDVGAEATCVSADGAAGPRGSWLVERDPAVQPISPHEAPAMVMVWPTEHALRGVAVVEPNQAYFAIDVWIGADAPDAATCASAGTWREKGTFRVELFGSELQNPSHRLVDFGEVVTTAAIRVRATRPQGYRVGMGFEGRPVTGTHRATCSRVIAFSPVGGDLADLPVDLSQRLSEYRLTDVGTADLVRHVPLPHPGRLAFAPDGALHAISNGALVTVDPATGATTTVIPASALNGPAGMAFDHEGNLLLTQTGASSVGVYDRQGKLLRTVGKAGRRGIGPFDPLTFSAPNSVAVASDGTIWIVEACSVPKRITRWSADGATVIKQFFGPAGYGGGGWLDPRDPSLLYYSGMKFRFDYAKRTSTLESIVFAGGEGPCLRTVPPDRVCYLGDRRYLVGDGMVSIICIERDGIAEPIVAAGNLNEWADVDADPALRAAFGRMNRGATGFVWSDRNGDRRPQPEEVQVVAAHTLMSRSGPDYERIGEDLSLRFLDCRLRPTGFTADGVPLYDAATIELGLPFGFGWGNADGTTIVVANNNGDGDGIRFTEADGKTTRWFYRDDYCGVHGSHRIGYDRQPGQLVGSNAVFGHFAAGTGTTKEDLYVVAGNHGDWFVFTHDGILATCLSGGPLHYGKRFWTVPECEPGKTDLSGLCVGEEHFGGSVIRADDGRVLMVMGHNHNSIVRVDGIDGIARTTGTITVTAEDQELSAAYIVRRQVAERARLGERVMVMPLRDPSGITVDGSLDDWDPGHFVTIEDRWEEREQRLIVLTCGGLAADSETLYIAGRVTDDSPMQNAASDPALSFKHGDAFDITLGLDPAAERGRIHAVAGDVRILLVPAKTGMHAVVYRPVVPGTAPDARRVFAFTGRTEVDEVRIIADAKVVFSPDKEGWTVEASIPWSDLVEVTPSAGEALLADLGVLKSDQNGLATVMRAYWTAKTQTVVSDVGFEARLTPALWGDLKVVEEEAPDLDVGSVRTR